MDYLSFHFLKLFLKTDHVSTHTTTKHTKYTILGSLPYLKERCELLISGNCSPLVSLSFLIVVRSHSPLQQSQRIVATAGFLSEVPARIHNTLACTRKILQWGVSSIIPHKQRALEACGLSPESYAPASDQRDMPLSFFFAVVITRNAEIIQIATMVSLAQDGVQYNSTITKRNMMKHGELPNQRKNRSVRIHTLQFERNAS